MKNLEYFTKKTYTNLSSVYANTEYKNIFNLDVSDSNLNVMPRIVFKVTFQEQGLFSLYTFEIGFFNKKLDLNQFQTLIGAIPIISITDFRTEQFVDSERGIFGVKYIFETIIHN